MHSTARLTTFALLLFASQAFAQTAGHTGRVAASPEAASDTSLAAPGVPLPKPKPVRDPNLYSTEVSVNSANEKRGATIRALGQVIVRLTGNAQAASNPVVRRAASDIDSLTTSAEIRQDTQTVNGVPVYRSILAASFDPDAVDAVIAGAGLKFWTGLRPKPMLWLAIDDGRGPRLVTGKETAVVKPLAMRGLERGMRYLLPAGTALELQAVPSIWSLNAAGIRVLSSRYRNDAQLIGKVYRQAPGWAADWLLTESGVELARWSFSDADPRKVIASGVDEGANAIAKRDAVYLDSGIAGLYSIDVIGVGSQADYLRLIAYLQHVPVVRKLTAVEANPDYLRLQVDLSVGMKGFRTMIGTSGALRAVSDTGEAPAPDAGKVPRFSLQ
ncbi:MAG: DUF2066 domain-containing protein [Arenimonas sp.]